MSNGLPLGEALAQLRDELRDARFQADDELKLNVTAIELELSLELDVKGSAEAGASLWRVVTAKAAAEHNRNRIHRLTLSIEPVVVDADGGESELRVSTPPVPDRDLGPQGGETHEQAGTGASRQDPDQ